MCTAMYTYRYISDLIVSSVLKKKQIQNEKNKYGRMTANKEQKQ